MNNPATTTPARFAPWLAVSLGVLLLVCAWLTLKIVRLVELRRENATLRAVAAQLEKLREDHAELERLRADARQAGSAAKDRAELATLRAEAGPLRAAAAELPALRDEARRLQTERAAAAARAGVQEETDPLAETKGRADRIACISNLKQIGLAARMWAGDHKVSGQTYLMAADFPSMSNYLSTPKILTCPGDRSRQRVENWAQFDGGSVSYEMLSPDGSENDPSVVYVRCSVHHNAGLMDGSAQMFDPASSRIEKVDGKYKLVRVNPAPGSNPP